MKACVVVIVFVGLCSESLRFILNLVKPFLCSISNLVKPLAFCKDVNSKKNYS